jgi:hypothetical protein
MTRYYTDVDALIRYVDDFLGFIKPLPNGQPDWKKAKRVFNQVCRLWDWLGVPFSKSDPPSLRLVWLGIELCSSTLKSYVPEIRRQHVINKLVLWKNKRSCTRR